MFFIFVLLLFNGSNGQSLNLDDINVRLQFMETKIGNLESEIRILKTQEQDLEAKIELKEVQADVSFILMEQVKLNDRNWAPLGLSHTTLLMKWIKTRFMAM